MSTRPLSAADWELWHSWMHAHRVITEEIDASLRTAAGVSKAEFSILRTLGQADSRTLRVGELASALRWDKSRVAHLLTRMEHRDLVTRLEDGAPGRRTAVVLSPNGESMLRDALLVHEESVSRMFVDGLTDDQAVAIRSLNERIALTAAGRLD